MDKRKDTLGTGCRNDGSGLKEKGSHFLPMIEQPPASLRKVNNLFADAQSAEPVTLPYAPTGSAGFPERAMEPCNSKGLNLGIISTGNSEKDHGTHECCHTESASQKSAYAITKIDGQKE